jgi:SAM-dependent methyltransferase
MSTRRARHEGWHGWDEYAPFYDWESARTIGRDDVPFWIELARQSGGPVLELGCGTGRVLVPVARAGVPVVGIDRSAPMLARARARIRRGHLSSVASIVRGDIRALPFDRRRFPLVMAPYGILQSLLSDADLRATLDSVARVLPKGGRFGIDLVPDLPAWDEYERQLRLHGPRGRTGGAVMLVETVRQDRTRRLTIFDQEYIERRGSTARHRRFSLVFRTLSLKQMSRRLEQAGFSMTAVLGDYDGRPWDRRAEVWIILAQRR